MYSFLCVSYLREAMTDFKLFLAAPGSRMCLWDGVSLATQGHQPQGAGAPHGGSYWASSKGDSDGTFLLAYTL